MKERVVFECCGKMMDSGHYLCRNHFMIVKFRISYKNSLALFSTPWFRGLWKK